MQYAWIALCISYQLPVAQPRVGTCPLCHGRVWSWDGADPKSILGVGTRQQTCVERHLIAANCLINLASGTSPGLCPWTPLCPPWLQSLATPLLTSYALIMFLKVLNRFVMKLKILWNISKKGSEIFQKFLWNFLNISKWNVSSCIPSCTSERWALKANSSNGLQIWCACFQGQSVHDPLNFFQQGGFCKY